MVSHFEGHEYLFVTVLENLPTNYTVSYIVCVNEDGQVLSQLNASLLSPDPILQYFAKLKVSTKVFILEPFSNFNLLVVTMFTILIQSTCQ